MSGGDKRSLWRPDGPTLLHPGFSHYTINQPAVESSIQKLILVRNFAASLEPVDQIY